MPVGTAPRPKVESKEEAEVVADPKLNQLIEQWDKAEEAKDGVWMKIAKYTRDKKITAKQLLAALVEIRGLKETSARVETSRFMRFQKSQEASDMLDEALSGGDVSVRDLRSAKVMTGEKAEEDDDEKYEKKLVSVAKFAIEKAGVDEETTFLKDARRAYKAAYKKASARHQTEGNGEGEPTTLDEEETED